jgi:hypothetical protein
MSYAAQARRIRDESLPYGRRVSALCSCVQLYRPIGFNATLSFLAEELAGPYERDEAALLRALDALTESRSRWLAEVYAYADRRTREKRDGRRRPHPADGDPSTGPQHWYGAARQAAVHALRLRHRRRVPPIPTENDPTAEQVQALIPVCLSTNGPLTEPERAVLTTSISSLRRRRTEEEGQAYYRSCELLRLAHLLTTAADNPT